jgi:hypothetical protein
MPAWGTMSVSFGAQRIARRFFFRPAARPPAYFVFGIGK